MAEKQATSTWKNTSILSGDIAQAIKGLKSQKGKDIMVYGGNSFVSSLIQNDLIDEYYLMVNPASIGDGQETFNPLKNDLALKLDTCRAFECGALLLRYTRRSGS